METKTENRELTYGEKSVGITFNPGGNEEVNSIKRKCADLIDDFNRARGQQDEQNGEKARMYSEAITNIQTGQMWAVKAATWQY